MGVKADASKDMKDRKAPKNSVARSITKVKKSTHQSLSHRLAKEPVTKKI